MESDRLELRKRAGCARPIGVLHNSPVTLRNERGHGIKIDKESGNYCQQRADRVPRVPRVSLDAPAPHRIMSGTNATGSDTSTARNTPMSTSSPKDRRQILMCRLHAPPAA